MCTNASSSGGSETWFIMCESCWENPLFRCQEVVLTNQHGSSQRRGCDVTSDAASWLKVATETPPRTSCNLAVPKKSPTAHQRGGERLFRNVSESEAEPSMCSENWRLKCKECYMLTHGRYTLLKRRRSALNLNTWWKTWIHMLWRQTPTAVEVKMESKPFSWPRLLLTYLSIMKVIYSFVNHFIFVIFHH